MIVAQMGELGRGGGGRGGGGGRRGGGFHRGGFRRRGGGSTIIFPSGDGWPWASEVVLVPVACDPGPLGDECRLQQRLRALGVF
jgi:hypothetical protein